jgi:hypothetical protein
VNAGELLVGIGTLALAGFTWRLAATTSASVAVARDSADAERASVDAMHLPDVIAVPSPVATLIEKHSDEYGDVRRADIPTQFTASRGRPCCGCGYGTSVSGQQSYGAPGERGLSTGSRGGASVRGKP